MEATRFNQFGYWKGEIRVRRQEGRGRSGARLRHQGSLLGHPARRRPGAARRALERGAGRSTSPGFLCTGRTDCTHAGIFENQYGVCWHWDGMIMPDLRSPGRDPGCRRPGHGAARGRRPPDPRVLPGDAPSASRAGLAQAPRRQASPTSSFESLLVYRMKGIGYTHPEWGHGKWKGELAIGGESWKIEDCDNMAVPNQHIQSVVKATLRGRGGRRRDGADPHGAEHEVRVQGVPRPGDVNRRHPAA